MRYSAFLSTPLYLYRQEVKGRHRDKAGLKPRGLALPTTYCIICMLQFLPQRRTGVGPLKMCLLRNVWGLTVGACTHTVLELR